MGAHVKQTEPYSPWQNAAELTIRELKKGAGRKAAGAQSPKKLWNHALELEAYVHCNTVVPHPKLDGQVTETIMSGQTADMSHFAELGWYDWIKFFYILTCYPEPKEVHGQWLGPAINIGPAMMSKVLKSNGQVIYASSYFLLTDDKMADPTETKLRAEFDTAITTGKLKKECARSFTSTVTISLGQADRRVPPALLFGCQARPTVGDLSSRTRTR